MVNFGLNSASILGIFLAVAGAGLYFMRSIKPELSRDHDIFFAAVGLLCGLILVFQGWRLDPILQFGQFLLTGVAVFFAFETVKLRGLATEQARRNSSGNSYVDYDRPVSREYRAELEQIEPYEQNDRYEDNPRLRGYDDGRTNRDSYTEEQPRPTRTGRRPNGGDNTPTRKSSGNRRPRENSRPTTTDRGGYGDNYGDYGSRPDSGGRPRRRPPTEENPSPDTRKRRPRPMIEDDPPFKGEYVDYQPIDDLNEYDNRDERERPPSKEDDTGRFDY